MAASGLTRYGLTLLTAAAAFTARAQDTQAGGHLLVGLPVGAFKDRIGNTGFGVAGHLAYHLPEQPYLIGLQIGFLNYGSQTVPMAAGGRTVDVTWSNNILLAHVIGRVQPRRGPFRPYVEGLIGLNWMFTTSAFQSWAAGDEEPSTTTNLEFDDTGFSYGGGGGILVASAVIFGGDEDGPEEETESGGGEGLLIDLGVRYLAGNRTQYLRSGSVSTSGGTVTFAAVESDTDLLLVQVGVSLRF